MTFHDPHQLVLTAVRNLYGDIRVEIKFDSSFRKWFFFFGCWGYTDFETNPPSIKISAYIPVFHSLEILAHELAHVVVGLEEGHGKAWEECFSNIHEEHHRLLLEEK